MSIRVNCGGMRRGEVRSARDQRAKRDGDKMLTPYAVDCVAQTTENIPGPMRGSRIFLENCCRTDFNVAYCNTYSAVKIRRTILGGDFAAVCGRRCEITASIGPC